MDKIIQHLRDLGNKVIEPICISEGICNELHYKFNIDIDVFVSIWKHNIDMFSGIDQYPIRHPEISDSHSSAAYFEEYDLWINEYGDIRRLWCLWLAQWLEDHPGYKLIMNED